MDMCMDMCVRCDDDLVGACMCACMHAHLHPHNPAWHAHRNWRHVLACSAWAITIYAITMYTQKLAARADVLCVTVSPTRVPT